VKISKRSKEKVLVWHSHALAPLEIAEFTDDNGFI
jgi:hypothetical protein